MIYEVYQAALQLGEAWIFQEGCALELLLCQFPDLVWVGEPPDVQESSIWDWDWDLLLLKMKKCII
jgi:hypothetical protein